MQQQIPVDLGREVARLAEGLNLDLDEAVREALQGWVERVKLGQAKRLPDVPIIEEEFVGVDLPRHEARPVHVVKGRGRLPDVRSAAE